MPKSRLEVWKMKTTIIYAHPYEESFNHAILSKEINLFSKKNHDLTVIDLYKDEFNPVFSKKELHLFHEGKTSDSLVRKYQKILQKTDQLVFIFPIWWNEAPAIITGFINKVMTPDFAYHDMSHGIKGLLNSIRDVTVITTPKSPTWYLKFFAGNSKSVYQFHLETNRYT